MHGHELEGGDAQSRIYEIRKSYKEDFWNKAESNHLYKWAYYTVKKGTHKEGIICTSGRRRLEVVSLL